MAGRFWKIGIVVALVVVVGLVFALKGRGPTGDAGKAGVVAASSPAAVEAAAQLPRLVDLGSTTCVPCKMMTPILEELKKECAGRLEVEFIDVTRDREAGALYRITLIPTQIFFDAAGVELFRHEGFFAKADILAKWKELGVNLEPTRAGEGK